MSKLPKDLRRRVGNQQLAIDKTFKQNLKEQLFTQSQGGFMAQKKTKVSARSLFRSVFKQLSTATGLAALAVLIVVGGMSAFVAANKTRLNSEQKTALPTNLADVLPIEDIRAAALKDVPDGTITGVELEQEEGALLYKVRFSDGSFRYYNAKTGVAVMRSQDETEQDESVPAGFVAGITVQQARDIALAQRSGSITKIELETENGVVVYSVRFSDGGRVDVNATSGAVLRVRSGSETNTSDDDSDDANDDSSETSDSGSSSDDTNSDDAEDSDNSGSGSDSNSGSGSDDSGSSGGGSSDD
ncbi:MAG: PepSY domain-containing protein [Candidatus Saccharimonadales bacterium]